MAVPLKTGGYPPQGDQPEDWRAHRPEKRPLRQVPPQVFFTRQVSSRTLSRCPTACWRSYCGDVAQTSTVTCPRLSGTWPGAQR